MLPSSNNYGYQVSAVLFCTNTENVRCFHTKAPIFTENSLTKPCSSFPKQTFLSASSELPPSSSFLYSRQRIVWRNCFRCCVQFVIVLCARISLLTTKLLNTDNWVIGPVHCFTSQFLIKSDFCTAE